MESTCFALLAPSYHRKLLLHYHNFYKVEWCGVSEHSESFPKMLLRGVLQIILFLQGETILTTISSFHVIPSNILLFESEISQTRMFNIHINNGSCGSYNIYLK